MDDYSDYPMGDEKSYQNNKKFGSPVHPNSSAAKHARARKEMLAKKIVQRPALPRSRTSDAAAGGINK